MADLVTGCGILKRDIGRFVEIIEFRNIKDNRTDPKNPA
jgi:hypothetical protein